MALRLAGESYLTIQGADNQGWLWEITAQDALPGLKIDQQSTGRIFDFQDGGISRMFMVDGGKVLLANVASPPATPESLMHLWTGDAGTVAPDANALLTLERSGTTPAVINFLVGGGEDVESGLFVGGPTNIPGRGRWVFSQGTTQYWAGYIAGSMKYKLMQSTLEFQQAHAIKTTAGDLTLDPAGAIDFNGNNLKGPGLVGNSWESTKLIFGTSFLEGSEITDPIAPSADKGRLYIRDNGSGKTQLVVRFNTGAIQVLATLP